MRLACIVSAFAAALFVVLPPRAQAAPQILAALPAESGIELSCADGMCAAQLSTYCLQRERPAPSMGTAYVPAADAHFVLVLQADNGREVRVAAGDHMRFTENRGFMAVAASLEHGRLRALGAMSAKLVVHENASLIPVAQPDDPNPLSADEIAYVTDSLRTHGKSYVDDTPEAGSAQLLAKLSAALPEGGVVTDNSFDGMWRQAIGDEIPVPGGGAVLNRARQDYQSCAERTHGQLTGGLKRCLEYRHDDLIRSLNIDYWQSQPGS